MPSSRRVSVDGARTASASTTPSSELSHLARVCRLRIRLPPSAWAASFSTDHPDVAVVILSRHDLDARWSLTEVRMHVPGPGPWMDEVRALPLVKEVELLSSDPSTYHFRAVHRTSVIVPIFRELQLERRFPFTIRGGEASWVVVASEAKLRRLIDRLRQRAPAVALESVRHTELHQPSGPLTPRQADLLHRAIAAGYFEIPRKVSLTELAQTLGVAASTLSEGLAIVEKKLVEHWPDDALTGDAAAS